VACKKQAWTSEPAMPLEHINFKNGRKCLVTSLLSNHSTLPSLLGKHLSMSEMHLKQKQKEFPIGNDAPDVPEWFTCSINAQK
jgi:hypothetical protein